MTRKLDEIKRDLAQEFPQHEDTFQGKGGQTLTYIPWSAVEDILDEYAPGWCKTIIREGFRKGEAADGTDDQFYCVVEISIPYIDDDEITRDTFSRQNYGYEYLKERTWNNDTKQYTVKEIGYGDVYSNAISMAFRRAAADAGVGRYLYDKEKKAARQQGQGAPAQGQHQQSGPQGQPSGNVAFPANPVAQNDSELISPKQIAACRAIAGSIGMDADVVCMNLLNTGLSTLSRRAASALIDYLKKQAGQVVRG